MITIKKLEKASIIFKQVQALDKEIIEIEKVAMMVADGCYSQSFSVSVNEKQTGVGGIKEVHLIEHPLREFMGMFGHSIQQKDAKKEENKTKLKYEIPDTVCLQLLGVLLSSKLQERALLLESMAKLGVKF